MRVVRRVLPLPYLPRKIIRSIRKDVLKHESAVIPVYDFRLEVPFQPGIGLHLFLFGERERDQYEIISSVIRKGGNVLDIGANIGYYCILEALQVGPEGRVYAFEPDRRNLEYLSHNIGLNGCGDRVVIHEAAISNFTGEAKFVLAKRANLNAMERSRGDEHESIQSRGLANRAYIGEVDIKVVDLGEFLASLTDRIDLIRMDLEGHEVRILSSLVTSALELKPAGKLPKAIVFEPHSWEYTDGHDLQPELKRLQDIGYAVTLLGSRDERDSPIRKFGYEPFLTVREKTGVTRGVYRDIDPDDALELASRVDGVTTVCLQLDAQAG